MKTKTFLALALLAVATILNAATQGNRSIRIKTTKVTKTLVQQWADAYHQLNPDVEITLVDKEEDANLSITTTPPNASDGRVGIIYVGRYAVLPVTPRDNPLYDEITSRQWNERDIRHLFFQSDDAFADERATKREKLTDRLTVFSGNNSTSTSATYARHFGYDKSDIRGKRIQGDDLYLLTAIQKEKQSVTFNNIAYLYDINSRHLRQDIAILPLDIKKEQEQTLLSGNLDETLTLLETTTISTIPVEGIAFAYKTFDSDIEQFLFWVVNEGQQYNNRAGYLRLDEKNKRQQLALLARL